ncbi:MAG: OB-fold nucleic acid binding domain-containing protein [Lachnospiraceae bacterium]|nr:OB-fold nucleic acid binding domain-containing protein [Lachnospiraceae bacterium]
MRDDNRKPEMNIMKRKVAKNGKKKIYRVPVLLLCIMNLVLGGSFWKQPEMTLDSEQHIVYQYVSLEKLLIRITSNPESAERTYLNQYFAVIGRIRVKSEDNKQMTLGVPGAYISDALQCNVSDTGLSDEIEGLKTGDIVKVYGKVTKGFLDGKWTFSVNQIEKTDETEISQTAYQTSGGPVLDREEMANRSLNGGKVTFYVPESWTNVERNLVEEGLGSMEGYQYCLNEIGQQSVQPESFFICYFDNDSHLLKSSDRDSTELIERAVVKNILKEDPGAADLKKTSYYGADYHYYQAAYKTVFGQNYRAEFVFRPDDTKGFVVYLYIYREKSHLDEIMTVMRLLEL